MDKFQAIHSFWSSFGIPAYDENTVPTGTEKPSFPYITYDATVGSLGDFIALSGSVWDYSTSWSVVTMKMAEIQSKISRGGLIVPVDDGALWIQRGSPFAQRVPDDNDMIRRIHINLTAEFFTAD